MRALRAAAITSLLCLSPPLWAQALLLAGPEGSAMSLEMALAKAKDGDTIELLPGEYRGALVLEQRRLTLRGMAGGKPPLITGDGKPVAAHALWTVRGGQVTLQHLEFRGARSTAGSGAGVRHEGGELLVRDCQFFDNEHGLLSSNDDKAQLRIESSVFGLAPKVVGGLHHLLNVGRIASFHVSGSRFQQGFEGHLIKSRARETLISYNFIHDSRRGDASYEIDIANGGMATVIGNIIGQGANSQNPVMLAYASEDRAWDRNELVVSHNTFVHYGWLPGWGVRVFSDHLPAGTPVTAINNLIVGPLLFAPGVSGRFEGNRHATRGMLRDIETYAFELPAGSRWRGAGVDPRAVDGKDLLPKGEFKWPVGVQLYGGGYNSWTPGASQR